VEKKEEFSEKVIDFVNKLLYNYYVLKNKEKEKNKNGRKQK